MYYVLTFILLFISINTNSTQIYFKCVPYSHSKEMIEVIKEYELYKSEPYILFGHKYVGYGHRTKSNNKITQKQAEILLIHDFYANYNSIDSSINYRYKILLTALAYNVGISTIKKSNIYRLAKKNVNYKTMYNEYIKYQYINGKKHKKLLERRIKEFTTICVYGQT